MNKKVIVLAALLTGCSTVAYRPIVDMKGVDRSAYEEDLKSCNFYAGMKDPLNDAFTGAMVGAALGAAYGALVGNAYGDVGYGASYGAQVGALTGGVATGAQGLSTQQAIVRRCLHGRGYNVLD